MRNNAVTVALMLATLSTTSIVHAAEPNLEKLSSVQADIILLKAENDREELIQKLKKLRAPALSEQVKEAAPQPAYSLTPPPSPSMQPQFTGQIPGNPSQAREAKPEAKIEKAPEVPTLRGVVGAGTKLFATVSYESGEEIEASAGDLLPGGFIVVSLSLNKLTLRDKAGKKIELLRSVGGERPPKETETSGITLTGQQPQGINFLGGVR